MSSIVTTSIVSFISTNIDNIFVMMVLYARVDETFKKKYVVIGQYLAIGILTAISLSAAFGLNFVPQKYVGLLGFIPIALGVKEWISYKRPAQNKSNRKEFPLETEKTEAAHPNKLQNILRNVTSIASKIVKPEILSVALVGVANGADNIGVYIPLFTGYSSIQVIITIIVFVLMMAVWCFLGEKITDFPKIKAIIQTYKYFAVPVVFVGLGIYIIIKSGLIT